MRITDISFGVEVDGVHFTITIDIGPRGRYGDGRSVVARVYAPGEVRKYGTFDEVLAALDGPALTAARFVIGRAVAALAKALRKVRAPQGKVVGNAHPG